MGFESKADLEKRSRERDWASQDEQAHSRMSFEPSPIREGRESHPQKDGDRVSRPCERPGVHPERILHERIVPPSEAQELP